MAILVRFKENWLKKEKMVKISDCLCRQSVLFLEVEKRDEALLKLVEALKASGKIEDDKLFLKAVLEREKIISTGIGMGVAIPHAKMKCFDDFFIAVGVVKGDGLDWKSLDNMPVNLIFLIGGPDNRQNDYLHILSKITSFIKDRSLRQKLLSADNQSQVLDAFANV